MGAERIVEGGDLRGGFELDVAAGVDGQFVATVSKLVSCCSSHEDGGGGDELSWDLALGPGKAFGGFVVHVVDHGLSEFVLFEQTGEMTHGDSQAHRRLTPAPASTAAATAALPAPSAPRAALWLF